MLGKVKRQKPQLELVLVSTDSEVSQTELQAVLLRHQLQSIRSYVFDDNVAQSLRYSIDPAWYGELPRSYLFDSQHRRRAVSGMLSEKFIMKWLSENE